MTRFFWNADVHDHVMRDPIEPLLLRTKAERRKNEHVLYFWTVSVYLRKISQKIRSSQTNNCDAILLRKFSLPLPSTQVVQDCKPALQPTIASASKTRFFKGGKRRFGGLSCENKMLKHKNVYLIWWRQLPTDRNLKFASCRGGWWENSLPKEATPIHSLAVDRPLNLPIERRTLNQLNAWKMF